MKPIKLHTPRPTIHLPPHEQAARRHRAATANLPGIPRSARRTRPTLTGRKTTHVDHPNLPSSRQLP